MPGFALRRDMAFEWNGGQFRIQQLNEQGQVLLQREIDGQMLLASNDELLSAYTAGTLRRASPVARGSTFDPGVFSRPLSEVPSHVQAEVTRRLHYLREVGSYGMPIFTPQYLDPLIKLAAQQIDDSHLPSAVSLYRWWRSFTSSGDPRSLIPRYDKRGCAESRHGDESLTLLKEAIEEAFLRSPRADGSIIYDGWKARINKANRQRTLVDQIKMPSRRTCYRLLAKVEIYDMLCLKEGQAAASRRLTIVMNGVKTSNILERVEMDHTPLDLFVIDERTWLPLGRPTFTIVLDHYSRMPLGYYLSFGGTSAHAVLSALRHAILPKTPAAEAVPGVSVVHAWPCYGVMEALVLDNGLEFHGFDLESAAFDLGFRLQYCPKRKPRFKGAVERFLKTINFNLMHHLPGTSMARLADRGDYDPAKHALLTLSELIHVLEKWLLDVYAQSFHRGIGTTPWTKWHEGLSRQVLELPPDCRMLQCRIGKTVTRSLRKPGIELHQLRYVSEVLQPMLYRHGEGVRVKVVFDAENLGSIQVWAPDASEPVEVPALDLDYAQGLTLLQHKQICKLVALNGRSVVDIDALHEARNQLAEGIAKLMSSRKQRDRRRAAALKGKTSRHPSGDLETRSTKPTKKQPKPRCDSGVPPEPFQPMAGGRP